jgi:tetratricopeptide (TPR) repeat protein
LHQSRYPEAVAEVAAIADDDPFAALARRIELWGLVAAGDLDEARALSARAAQSGVPASDLELFARWISLAAGEPAPRGLPITATLMLGVILETLLQAHDFERFAMLLPLLQQSDLPEREQHELLGSMYLRHGFLVSAAQEWMHVCESEPDARALAGLANVALAHGQMEEAIVFADQALMLDPESVTARKVLARCPAPAVGGKLEIH